MIIYVFNINYELIYLFFSGFWDDRDGCNVYVGLGGNEYIDINLEIILIKFSLS